MDSVIIGGEQRTLGCLPRKSPVGTVFPTFASRLPMIPRSEWKPVDWSYLVDIVLDQDGIGACAGFSGASTVMALGRAAGYEPVELSGGHLYGQVNSQRDQGAFLSDTIKALTQTGVCPASAVGQLEWRMRSWPSNWKELAREHRALEAFDCNTFDQIAVAVQRGFIVSFGVMIGQGFEPDAEGYIPAMRRSAGGHAITAVGLHYGRNAFWVKILNSWSSRWGMQGYAYVPESYFQGEFVDGWALRSISHRGN